MILLFFAFIIILILLLLIPEIIGRWFLFKKAGKNGWEAIIPFYSNYVYVEIAGLHWWYFLLLIANSITAISDELQFIIYPASIIATFFCNYNISKKLNKDTTTAVLMTLFPFVMLPIIGFSKDYNWDNNVTVSPNGPINSQTNNNTSSSNNTYKPNENTNSSYCVNCGSKLREDAKFCPNCGKEI